MADLLDLARLDAHQFSLAPRPIDAREVVAETVDAFRPQAEDIGLTIELSANEAMPIDADPERLAQIVANLVENALKFATSSVTVGLTRSDGVAQITVSDDGPGISPEDLPHVFQRLYASHRAGSRWAPGSASRSCVSSPARWAATRTSSRTGVSAPASS